jgi:hypothetical protein
MFFKKSIWVSKNAEFDADFESVEKDARNSRNSCKKVCNEK